MSSYFNAASVGYTLLVVFLGYLCISIEFSHKLADVKNPARRGHKVEKHYPEVNNVRRTLHIKRKRQRYEKYSEKMNLQINKRKKERNTCGFGATAYRRTIERRAAASTKKA